MARPCTDAMARALRARKPIALFAEIDHPDELAHFWTGVGKINWSGFDWTGVGKLGGIAPVRYSADVAIQQVVFKLSGVKPDAAAWLSTNVKNRTAQAWLACIDCGRVVPDPIYLFEALLDYPSQNADPDGSLTLSLNALTGFYTLERALNEVWSAQDQQNTYPDDTGFNRMARLQNQEVKWSLT